MASLQQHAAGDAPVPRGAAARCSMSYPDVVTLGEISSDDSNATVAEYTQPGRLHMAYSFELLVDESSPAHIRGTVEALLSRAPRELAVLDGLESRRGTGGESLGTQRDPRCRHFATQLTALLCALRGSVCVFQGEELGLGEADVPFEALRDPYGIAFWPDPSRAATAAARPCPGKRANAAASRRRTLAAGSAPASRAVGRGPGERSNFGVAGVSAACSRWRKSAAAAAHGRHRIPRGHGCPCSHSALRWRRRTAGGIQSVGRTGERVAARHLRWRASSRSRSARGLV